MFVHFHSGVLNRADNMPKPHGARYVNLATSSGSRQIRRLNFIKTLVVFPIASHRSEVPLPLPWA
jgi:hypothetical protein